MFLAETGDSSFTKGTTPFLPIVTVQGDTIFLVLLFILFLYLPTPPPRSLITVGLEVSLMFGTSRLNYFLCPFPRVLVALVRDQETH